MFPALEDATKANQNNGQVIKYLKILGEISMVGYSVTETEVIVVTPEISHLAGFGFYSFCD